jgi:hypothetical protein
MGADARGPEEIDPAFAAMAAAGVNALFLLAELTFVNAPLVLEDAMERSIPIFAQ